MSLCLFCISLTLFCAFLKLICISVSVLCFLTLVLHVCSHFLSIWSCLCLLVVSCSYFASLCLCLVAVTLSVSVFVLRLFVILHVFTELSDSHQSHRFLSSSIVWSSRAFESSCEFSHRAPGWSLLLREGRKERM